MGESASQGQPRAPPGQSGLPRATMLDSMHPFLELTDLLPDLRQPPVRDLAWTLVSAPLLADSAWPQRHPLAGSGWATQPGRLADWLGRLDEQPAPLCEWLAQGSGRRLGLYYERLWQFALRAAPGVQLLACNLPIRLGGRTLGELDLLLRDGEGVHHMELAVKLYLGPRAGDGRDPAQWLGPGAEDRLDRKLDHLARHQLPLSSSRHGKLALADLRQDDLQAEFWLGGYFIYPWPHGCAAPLGAHPHHCRGRWLTREQFAAFRAQAAPGPWQPLPRQAWLASARLSAEEVWSAPRLTAWLRQLPDAAAELLVRVEEEKAGTWKEAERIFLMPDAWPPEQAGD